MLGEGDFKSIAAMVRRMLGEKGEYFVSGLVIKRDAKRKLVWLAEFGDQAIPIVGFSHTVKYYDTNQVGKVLPKISKVEVVVPAIGDSVLVARELGTRRLPRCLGVIQGTGWITPPED